MKKIFLWLFIFVIFLISFTSLIGAQIETHTWQRLFQVNIPSFNQFTIGGFLNSQIGIAVGHFGVIRYSSDGGKSWQNAQNDSSCRYGLDIVNDKISWNCGDYGNIQKSNDAGASWETVSDYGDSVPNHNRFISFSDEKTGWVASPTKLGKTVDGGVHWVDMKLPEGCGDLTAIFLRTSTEGYLLDMSGNLFITQDGGKVWTTKTIGMIFKSHKNMPYIAINFSDIQHGEIVIGIGGQTQALSTDDGGATWKKELISENDGGYIFLSRDGQYLTVSGMTDAKLTVYQYK